jgi:hypothetical protein
MKLNMIRLIAVTLGGSVLFSACQKSSKTPNAEVSQDVISQIQALGFNTYGVKKVSEGYLVENDIILTEENLKNANSNSPEMVIANEEHYRTTNLVTGLPRTLTVSLNTAAAPFPAALTEALKRYNDQGLQLSFVQGASNPDINIVTFYEVSNTLGSSGFPTGGNPYNQVRMNTYWYTANTNVNYMASILAHEIGHCIGYRHTDYMNRKYSCGSGGPFNNEGSAGIGAIWIPGTPTKGDANSWMLACIGGGVNRPFTANDITALTTVY